MFELSVSKYMKIYIYNNDTRRLPTYLLALIVMDLKSSVE